MTHLCVHVAVASALDPARCTRQEATDFQAPGSKCPSKPCADLGGEGGEAHGFGAADAQACCQLCADYTGNEVCKYAVFQPAANKNKNCFLKAAPADAIVGGTGNLGMQLLPPSSGWGSTLLLILLLLCGGYMGGGVVLGMRTSGKKGLAAHPHYHKWINLQGLVVDGLRSTSGRSSGPANQRSVRDPEASGSYHSTAETEPLQPRRHDRKKGSASKEKRQKAAGGGKERQGQKGSGAAAAKSPPGPVPASARGRGSAAGDGGRWVHVPS